MDARGEAKRAVMACIIVAGLCGTGLARVVYVDDDAAGTGDGTSWNSAYRYLQDALVPAQRGDEIRVAQGVYRPDEGAAVWSRPTRTEPVPQELSFYLPQGVTIMGGFAGIGADDPNERDVEQYESILSGDLAGNDDDSWQPWHPIYEFLRADNSWCIVVSEKTDSTAVLDGLTIERALDTGMYIHDGSPVVVNCAFRRNSASLFMPTYLGYQPGDGGAICCFEADPNLSHCTFEANAAGNRGGAIYAAPAGLTLSHCRFVGNWAMDRGGAIFVHGELTLADCLFEANAATDRGGAVYQLIGAIELARSTFGGNVAGQGGAVAYEGSAAVMDGCSFIANRASSGGAVFNEHYGLSHADQGAGQIDNCLFAGNRADLTAGAVYAEARFPYLISNCTFAGNWAPSGSALVPSAWSSAETTVTNCIVWDGSESILDKSTNSRRGGDSRRPVTIAYSDVQGGWPGEGNIDVDPCFASLGYWVDAADPNVAVEPNHPGAVWVEGDYHLKSQAGRWDAASASWVLDDVTSPCIDAGDPKSVAGEEPMPNGGRINMGAYAGTAEASQSYPVVP